MGDFVFPPSRFYSGLEYKGMKNVEVTFPLIEDIKMEVANKLG